MAALDDSLAAVFDDGVFTSLVPGCDLTTRLAESVVHVLDRYPTADPDFRARVHAVARELYPTWEDVANAYLGLAEP
jgi:hypothetical protein